MVYKPQIVKLNGDTEFVVMPLEEWQRIEHDLYENEDKQSVADWRKKEQETLPHSFVEKIVEGQNPLKLWRNFREYSQTDLAKKCDISSAYLSQLEAGKRQPSLEIIKKLSKILKVDVDDLI